MLSTKFQATEPGGSQEETFGIFFYLSLWFKPRNPWGRAIFGHWEHHWYKLGKVPKGNATYQMSSI